MDNLTPKQRSLCMSRIKYKNTKPELFFRKLIWAGNIRGYHLKNNLKGKPDLFFSKQKIAVFIDGCFWHKCPKCFVKPKSNSTYWNKKINNNVKRDAETTRWLQNEGIHVIRIWEHEIKKNPKKSLSRFKKIYEKTIKNS